MKVLVTTYPFGVHYCGPVEILNTAGYKVILNEQREKQSHSRIRNLIREENPDAIIAGGEKYDQKMIDLCKKVKIIARVGQGVDNINVRYCREKNIRVANTPGCSINSVTELVIAQMINMLRRIPEVSQLISHRKWERYIGRELKNCKVGIIGCGKIGFNVLYRLINFTSKDIYVCDLIPEKIPRYNRIIVSDKESVLRNSDVITIHIPMNETNKDLISYRELEIMKSDACLLNMSRGGIVNEIALINWLETHPQASAAIDTFQCEPCYEEWVNACNLYPTPHIGSCTNVSRTDMETGAAIEVVKCLSGKPAINEVLE